MIARLRLAGRVLVFALGVSMASGVAYAHSGNVQAGPDSGVEIPGVTHGQMAVIDRFSGRITDLASRQFAPDKDFRRILNYARIQQTYCAWGLMPGGVSDEASPFNACSHAYLAALQDILVRMTAMSPPDPRVATLARSVDVAMIEAGSALVLCAFSTETFNTALILKPDWWAVPYHQASLASLLAAAVIAIAMIAAAARFLRAPQPGRQPV
jgi:hypothetical protein